MRSTHPDPDREDRILNEVIVDCYDEEEEETSWFYYLNDEVSYPFSAVVRLSKKGGQTEEKTVEVVEMDPEAENGGTLRMGITEPGQKRVQYIPLSDFVKADTTDDNLQALNDWLYWHDFELLSSASIPQQASAPLARIPVDSSMLAAVGYDAATKTLYAEFNSGDIWAYDGVSKRTFDQLRKTDSVGRFMRDEILGMYAEYRVRRGKDFKW
jgi:hypothetical protein